MADENEVVSILEQLVDANLSYPPRDIKATGRIWASLLGDIPSETLKQAAIDLIITSSEFPKLRDLRKAAENVTAHNGASAAPNRFFTQPVAEQKIIWIASGAERAEFPPEIEDKIQRIINRLGDDVLPQKTLDYIDALTKPYTGEPCTQS